MKEPIRPFPPMKYQYEARVDRKYIYKYEEDLDPEGVFEHDDDDDEEEDKEEEKLPEKDIEDVNLAWLIKQIPPSKSPKDIKIEFGYNYNCMAMEDHYVNFYYEVKVPARMDDYKADLKAYKEAEKQYEADLAKYNEFLKNKEIKETEEKLARLKGSK